MLNEMCVIDENVKYSKLLVLFNTLEESDKDIVINMSESLADKCKNMTKIVSYFSDKKGEHKKNVI
jgi:hypothetical protein